MTPNSKNISYWEKLVAPYKSNPIHKSLFQLFSTLTFLFSLCYVMFLLEENYYYLSLVAAIPASLFVVKIFIIQHDCGHGSFFKSKKLNDITGRLLTVFTATPYDQWKKEHNRHHATSGNLNNRGVGDITTLTVDEFKSKSWIKKFGYRIYRNPFFLLTIGSFLQFVVVHRVPLYKVKRLSSWISSMSTTIYMVLFCAFFSYLIGPATFFKLYVPIIGLAAAIGTWFFYIQHQYENAYWEENHNWNYCDAALHGSSYYDVPKWLKWITGNISYHHIHHLSAKIPNYNLAKCHEAVKDFCSPVRMGILDSFKCANLALWDTVNKKMVTFKQAKYL